LQIVGLLSYHLRKSIVLLRRKTGLAVTLHDVNKSNPVEGVACPLDISVIIPVYNEEENLSLLYQGMKPVLEGLGKSFDIIFVDDGSRDGSSDVLSALNKADARCRVIRFRRNFGQTAAMSAGFAHAKGGVIITLDADLQNDPGDIPMLLQKVDEGYDVVSGWRLHRKDKFLTRRVPSMCANWLISRITGVRLHDYGCTLKAYRSEVAQNIDLYGEMHRFIPALASWMGISVAEIPVNHHPRQHGKSKYGLSRTMRVFLDLITVKFLLSYSTKPLQMFGSVGVLASLLGAGIAGYLSYDKIFRGHALSNRPMLFLAILMILVGIQFITMGLLGEMMARIYHDGQKKPIYVIKEILE
jgi:glycosyltransferase involved in cell wall biosynthesis